MRFDCISAAHGEKFGLSNLGRLAFCRSGFGDIGSGLAQALISDEVKRYNELP
jgi:hypothetical protein